MPMVEVPGYGDVDFPDEMTDDEIAETLRSLAMPKPAAAEAKSAQAVSTGTKPSGFLRGLKDPIDAGAQLLPRGLEYLTSLGGYADNPVSGFFGAEADRVDNMVREDEKTYQLARMGERYGLEEPDFDWARLGGNVLNPVNIVAGAGLARAVPQGTRILGNAVLPTLGRGAVTGAGLGALQPVIGEDFRSEKLEQVAGGAIAGPLAELGVGALGRMIRPQTGAQQRLLMDEGVRLTPGQIMGGFPKRIEDALTSIPFLGSGVNQARQRSVDDLNRAAGTRALRPVGESVPRTVEPGRDLVNYVEDALGKKYQALLPRVQFKPDPQFAQELATAKSMATLLPDSQAKQFDNILKDKLINRMTPQGNMNGESFKAAESSLRAEARGYRSSADYDQRKLGEALDAVVDSLRAGLARANPAQADELNKINQGWANFARLRRAASGAGAEEGTFTPAQLQAAVRAKSGGVDKSQFARGDALMQDLSEAAKTVLPSKLPNSGTTDRALVAGSLGVGGAGVAGLLPAAFPTTTAAALLGGASLYTEPAQWLLRQALASRPAAAQPLSNYVTKLGKTPAILGLLPTTQAWADQSDDNEQP